MRHRIKEIEVKCLCIKFLAVAWIVLATAPVQAFSPNTDITELEWQEWPDFCRIAYLRSDFSSGSRFKKRMSWQAVKDGEKLVNQIGISGSHHFCVGLILYHRAVRGSLTGQARRDAMYRATNEFKYSFENTDERNVGYILAADYYGRALHLSANRDAAYRIWTDCIELRPGNTRCYVSMSDALLKDNEAEKAWQLLEGFPEKDASRLPDFRYAEAKTLHALGRLDESRAIAKELVSQGYPAKALLEQLEKGRSSGK